MKQADALKLIKAKQSSKARAAYDTRFDVSLSLIPFSLLRSLSFSRFSSLARFHSVICMCAASCPRGMIEAVVFPDEFSIETQLARLDIGHFFEIIFFSLIVSIVRLRCV